MHTLIRSFFVVGVIALGMFAAAKPAIADPSFGSDAAFPVLGVAPNTVLDVVPGAPVMGPVPPPPAAVLPSLLAPPNPPGFGEVDDISYGNESPLVFPLTIEFSVGLGLGGAPTTGHPAAPPPPAIAFDVRMEAGLVGVPPFGDGAVNSDVYMNFPAPLFGPPPCGIGSNRQILDGDGAPGPPFGPPRLGLGMPEPGSNLDAYERSDDSTVTSIPGAPLIDAPIFFTIDAATAAAWPPAFPIPAPGPPATVAIPGPSDILAWNPAIGGPVIWATAAALGLGPGNDIDALAVMSTPGTMLPPFGPGGWNLTPAGEVIVFSLAPASPALSPTSGGIAVPALASLCFGPGTATSGDLFFKTAPFGPLPAPYADAEQGGLATDRSIAGPGPPDDNVDAVDICNAFVGLDIDGDMIDSGCDYDDDGDGIGDTIDFSDDGDAFGDPQQVLHLGPANTALAFDNCPMVPNPGQENADGNHVDTSPPFVVAIDDKTWAMSDAAGDACDSDDDNDGLSDIVEMGGPPCASASAATSPLLRDSDGDNALDGAECALSFDPASSVSLPALTDCGVAGDADGDKITNRLEFCYYNTSNGSGDSDSDDPLDGTFDGCEIASINGDLTVDSGDQGKLAAGIIGTVPYHAGIDINKDLILNSGDQGLQASFIVPPGQCP